jgi:transcriptional regulator with XRE-family HTH domain
MALRPDRLKIRRQALNLSQEQLAELTGVNQPQVSRWELAQNDITGDTLGTLAQVLGVSTDWLLGLTNEEGISARSDTDLSDTELEVVTALRTTKPGRRQAILNIVREITTLE